MGAGARWPTDPDALQPPAARAMAGLPAILKIVVEPEERLGAARVHAYEDDATLLERAEGKRSLLTLAMNEADDDASRIICKTVRILHEPRDKPYTELVPLDNWFRALEPAAQSHGAFCAHRQRSQKPWLPSLAKSRRCTATTAIFSISKTEAGWPSTRKVFSANEVMTTPICSAIPICQRPRTRIGCGSSYRSSPGNPVLRRSACCAGSSPMPGSRRPGSWKTAAIRAQRYVSPKLLRRNSPIAPERSAIRHDLSAVQRPCPSLELRQTAGEI